MKSFIPKFSEELSGGLKELVKVLKERGADFAEAKYLKSRKELFNSRNGKVSRPYIKISSGVGVRALVNGAWGFSSTDDTSPESLRKAGEAAMSIAAAAAAINRNKIILPEREKSVGEYGTHYEINPFKPAIEEKLALLDKWDLQLRTKKNVKISKAGISCVSFEKLYISSDGSDTRQGFMYVSAGVQAGVVEGEEVLFRSYPADYYGNRQAGWEYIASLEINDNIDKIHQELEELQTAPATSAGMKDLILSGPQLALQIHESCGHPSELDRVLGEELSLAGSSFLTVERFKQKYRYGSKKVNITADSTLEGGMGTFGWDDEGTPASRQHIIKDGVLSGFLASRETAAKTGAPLHGAVRADEWSSFPIIRMTNVSLLPGNDGTLGDLIAGTDDGIMIDVNRSWSIDDKRLNFQFGGELAYEIKHGKITRILKSPLYTGITPEFWRSMDAVCNESEWRLHGVPHCGKGDPMQIMMVGHGCAPARFRNVEIGSRK